MRFKRKQRSKIWTKYIELGLRGRVDPISGNLRRRADALPVAIERTPGKPLTQALSNRELNRLLEHEGLQDARCPSSES
mgnify:CR=1 FL=1